MRRFGNLAAWSVLGAWVARYPFDDGNHEHGGLSSRSARVLVVIFIVTSLAVAVLGRLYYDSGRNQIIASSGAELLSIRDLKVDQIALWRAGLLRDGEWFANDPTLRDELGHWIADPNDPVAREALRTWMSLVVREGDYSGAILVSRDGHQTLAATGAAPPDPVSIAEAMRARDSREATLTDLFLDPTTQQPRLDVVAPLLAGGDRASAVVVLKRDPRTYLFPLLQSWSSPSASAETLLLRRQGDTALYLNDLRFRKNSALRFSRSAKVKSLLAAQALAGADGVVQGTDYRGASVIGAVGPVRGTNWYMVVKLDQSEAFARITASQRRIASAAIALIAFIGLGLALAWRIRMAEYYRLRYEDERSGRLLSQQYGHLTRYANDAIILADEDLHILEVNPRAASLYGYTERELLGMSLDTLLESFEALPGTTLVSTLESTDDHVLDLGQRRADGSLFEAEISTQAILDEGKTLHLTIVRDTTSQRQAALALRESEDRLRRAVMLAPFPMMLHAEDGSVVLINSAWESITGYTLDDIPTTAAWADKAYGFHAERVLTDIETLYGIEGQQREGEYTITTASGESRVWDFTSAPLGRDAHGLRVIISSAVDITERKAAEEELRKTSSYLENLINYANAPIIVWDPTQHITRFNHAFERMTGMTADNVVGQPLSMLFPDDTRASSLEKIVRATEGESWESVEIPIRRADGAVRVALWNSANVYARGDDGELLAVIAQGQDITERKAAEEDLRHRTAELVRSNSELEKFAYIASHDLQEPLRMVASYTQLLQRRYQGQLDEEADEFIEYAVDGAKRMQSLINELLVYSSVGSQGMPFVEADLEPVLEGVLKSIEIAVSETGAVITHDSMPTVFCDPTQIGQVFQNLLTNALKFHGQAPPVIHVGIAHVAEEWVFSVSDNGIGIEHRYFDRIFVIFQRLESRAEYSGTGMGLAICKRIIERHGGRIWLESQPGAGSTFCFALHDKPVEIRARA